MSSAGLSVGELLGTISLVDNLSGPLDKVAKTVGMSSESFTALAGAAGMATGLLVGVTGAVVALGQHGAEVADVQDAFDDLTGAAGATASTMLGALREGTLGTISDFQLMKAANGVLGTGMVTTADQMKTLAAGAQLLADRTGGDTAEAFDTLTSAMATGRTTALKSMGVMVDSDAAVQNYANSVHKSVGSLTDQEVAAAKAGAVIGALKSALDANGPATADFSDRINQGKAAIANFTDNVAVAIAKSPALAVAMDTISGAIKSTFGGDNQTAVQTISEYVTKFGIFLVDVAQVGVSSARFLTDAFNGAKLIFNLVLEALFTGIGKAADVLADLYEKASTAPVIGKAFEGIAGAMRTVADTSDSLALGFKEQGDKAYDAATRSTAAFDTVDLALAKMKEGMEKAHGAAVELGEKGPAAVRKLIEPVGLTAAEMDKLDEAFRRGQEAFEELGTQGAEKFRTLQEELTLANMTGVEARLFEVQLAQTKEMEGLEALRTAYPEIYAANAAMVVEKYRLMSDAAVDAATAQIEASTSAGLSQRQQSAQTLADAQAHFDALVSSGKATYSQLERAFAASKAAEKKVEDSRHAEALQHFSDIAGAASTMLKSIFGKSKAAAIAAVIIDTSAAIVKVLAQLGWWGVPMAAAIGAQGYAELQKIRGTNAEGFAEGTPGTSFVDFGTETMIAVHGPEAIVNASQGATLGEMLSSQVADALSSRQDLATAEIRGLREDMETDRRLLPYRLRDAIAMGSA